jgi:transposase InsO family protein
MVTPDQRREAVAHVQAKGLSGRAACRWTGLSRTVLRYAAKQAQVDQARLKPMREASQRQPRFGYRRVAVLAGVSFKIAWRLWKIGHFRLEKPRLRRRRGVGSDPRPERAERPNHVWTYDFLHDQLADGKRFKTLSVLDEFTRECLAIHVGQSIRAQHVTRVLADVIATRGAPAFVRSDNGSEFTATAVMAWLRDQQVGPTFIAPGRPWQNGYIESFHSRFRDECLNREWFQSGAEAAQVIEAWRQQYNTQRPHSSLGYRTPAQVAAEAVTN